MKKKMVCLALMSFVSTAFADWTSPGPNINKEDVMKKVMMMLAALLLCGFGVEANADGWTTPAAVTYINQWSSGFAFVLDRVGVQCTGAGNQIVVSWSNNNANQVYAAILAAYESGDLVAANVTCSSGQSLTNNIDIRKQ